MSDAPTLAKLTPPSLSNVYHRTRLFKRLDEVRKQPVVWVSASAGSGKTTLVSSYLQQNKIKPWWYQVDEGDADLASFFYYLGRLDRQINPRRKRPLPLLTPEYLAGLPIFTRNFFRELYARMKTPGVLVLDNFQDGGTDIPLHQFLPQALAEIPKGINVMVISRADPPASLTRLQASDGMAVLRRDDLRLTEEEGIGVGTLRSQEKQIDDAFYRELTRLTDGWVTGLVLYLERAAGTNVPDAIKQQPDQKAIFDYFAGEILDRLDVRSQTILQRTAFLPKISATAARELSNDATADQLLDELADRNAFTVCHTGSEATYEYHPLYREFLQTRARQTFGAAELSTLLCESARQLESTGYIEDAVELLQQAQEWSESSRIILGAARTLIEQGRGLAVADWIKAIPAQILNDQPWLSYWCGIAQLPHSPPQARTRLEQAYGGFKAIKETAGQLLAWCSIVDTFVYEYGDFHPLDEWIAEMDAWLQGGADYPSPEIQARVAFGMFTALMWRQPDRDELRDHWEPRVRDLVVKGNNPLGQVQFGSQLLLYYVWWAGDSDKARLILDTLRPLAASADTPPLVQVIWNFTLSTYYLACAEFEQLFEVVDKGLHVTNEEGVRVYESIISSIAVLGGITSSNSKIIGPYLDRIEGLRNPARYLDIAQYHFLLAYVAWSEKKTGSVVEQANLACEWGKKSGCPYHILYYSWEVALSMASGGRYQEALKLNDEIRREAEKYHVVSVEHATYMLEAELGIDVNDSERCINAIRPGLKLGRECNYRNYMSWRADLVRQLFVIALDNDIETDFVCSLIRQRHLIPPDDLPVPDAWPFPVKVYTLGRFSLLIDDEPVVFKGKAPKKALELLKALIALGGREVSTEKLTEALWPDAEGDSAYQNFTMALQRLRQLLKYKDALTLTEAKLTLDPRYAWVDCWAFERGVQGEGATQRAHALDLYKGSFLEHEADAPWLLSPRERLQQSYLRGLKAQGQCLEDTNQIDEAAALYEQALLTDPLDESFYQGLMRCQLTLGRNAEAARTYQRCEAVLKEALGVGPSPKTVAVFRDSLNC